jgi:hypothetical protein
MAAAAISYRFLVVADPEIFENAEERRMKLDNNLNNDIV